jgi:hypothetical protein
MSGDSLRTAIMLVVTNVLALGTAFGLNLSGDQVGAIVAVGNSTLILFFMLWKKGQETGT